MGIYDIGGAPRKRRLSDGNAVENVAIEAISEKAFQLFRYTIHTTKKMCALKKKKKGKTQAWFVYGEYIPVAFMFT